MSIRKETFHEKGEAIVERVKRLVHEGNVRRIVIKHNGHVVMEIPVTIGVVAIIFAPVIAAVGAIAVAIGEATIEVERVDEPGAPPTEER